VRGECADDAGAQAVDLVRVHGQGCRIEHVIPIRGHEEQFILVDHHVVDRVYHCRG